MTLFVLCRQTVNRFGPVQGVDRKTFVPESLFFRILLVFVFDPDRRKPEADAEEHRVVHALILLLQLLLLQLLMSLMLFQLSGLAVRQIFVFRETGGSSRGSGGLVDGVEEVVDLHVLVFLVQYRQLIQVRRWGKVWSWNFGTALDLRRTI